MLQWVALTIKQYTESGEGTSPTEETSTATSNLFSAAQKGKRAARTANLFRCPARREKTVGFVLNSEAEKVVLRLARDLRGRYCELCSLLL